MKKSLIIIALLFATVVSVDANNNNSKEKKAVVSNYADVLGKIEYPEVCREKAIEGTVLVSISLSKKGNINHYEFLDFPCSDLKDAVEKIIPELNFIPATVDGKAVTSKIIIPVTFKLEY